jgi:hypothetical protein
MFFTVFEQILKKLHTLGIYPMEKSQNLGKITSTDFKAHKDRDFPKLTKSTEKIIFDDPKQRLSAILFFNFDLKDLFPKLGPVASPPYFDTKSTYLFKTLEARPILSATDRVAERIGLAFGSFLNPIF